MNIENVIIERIMDAKTIEQTGVIIGELLARVTEMKKAILDALIELDHEKENQRYSQSIHLTRAIEYLENVK